MKNSLTATKWLLGIVGAVMIVIGFWMFAQPIAAMLTEIIFLGILLLISAVFYLISFFMNLRTPMAGWMLVAAILNFLMAMLFLGRPGLAWEVIIFLFGIWAVALGATHFANAFTLRAHKQDNWIWQLLSGILGVVFGLLIIFNPFAGFIATNWIIAFGFVFYGIANIMGGIYLQKNQKELLKFYKTFV